MRRRPPSAALVAAAALTLALATVLVRSPRAEHEVDAGAARLTAAERARVLDAQRAAEAAGDAARLAAARGRLGRDALVRARGILDAWLARREPATGLLPHGTPPARWTAGDVGADLWSHLLVAAHELEPAALPALLVALDSERRICGPLPCTIRFAPVRRAPLEPRARIAGALEFAADGLLPAAERFGPGPWLDRLAEVLDAVVARSAVATPAGPIPAADAESSGNFLQAAARLAHRTRDERLVAAIERVADAWLLHVVPAAGGLPAHAWDFARARPAVDRFHFRDHGAEIVPGLAEAYRLERALARPSAARHREPLRLLLDAVLARGRTADELWADDVVLSTGRATGGPIDTWGYLLAAHAMTDLADGTRDYEEPIRAVVGAAAAKAGFAWEGTQPDGAADAVESMLLFLAFFDFAEGRDFVDEQVPALWALERPDGSGGAGYLDGNLVRSSLLYAEWKSAGVAARPWRADLALGAARGADGSWVVSLEAGRPWRGRLRFDLPRHRTVWSMPFAHPRRNAPPEWLTVEPGARYLVRDLLAGVERGVSGAELAAGLPVTARAGIPVLLRVAPAPGAATR
jgi:hypothetical protein